MVPPRSDAARQPARPGRTEATVMRRSLQAFVDAVTRPGVYLTLLAFFIVLFIWMEIPALPYSAADFATHTNGGYTLDMKVGYSPDLAYQVLGGYGADGRAYYVWKLLVNDTAFPVVYSLLFAGTLALLLNRLTRPDSKLLYMAFLPLAGGILDMLENAGIISMLLAYPARLDWIAAMTSLITAVKLSVNVTAMGLIVAGLAIALLGIASSTVRPAGSRR